MAKINEVFSTGNSVVAGLPVGTLIEVVGQGQLQVVELPVKEFVAGDRIVTKYGNSTVVDASSRFSYIDGFDPETQVLYVADGSFRVRAAAISSLQ